MSLCGRIELEPVNAFGVAVASGGVAEALRGAMREVLAELVDGACRVPGACDAAKPCVVCSLLGAPGRPGRVAVFATIVADSRRTVRFDLDPGDEVARVALAAVREVSIHGARYRVRTLEWGGATTADVAAAEQASEEIGDNVILSVVAETPVLAAGFAWGDRFRWGAAPSIPGSAVRGALKIAGGRVGALFVRGLSHRQVTIRRGPAGEFVEEALAAGTELEGRITFVPGAPRSDLPTRFTLGAGRNRGYGRVQAIWRRDDGGSHEPLEFAETDGRIMVAVSLVTDAVVADRAALGRELFGDVDATLVESVIAAGPTGATVSWVRGRAAIPAESRFLFAIAKERREAAATSLGVALNRGIGFGREDGYGEVTLQRGSK